MTTKFAFFLFFFFHLSLLCLLDEKAWGYKVCHESPWERLTTQCWISKRYIESYYVNILRHCLFNVLHTSVMDDWSTVIMMTECLHYLRGKKSYRSYHIHFLKRFSQCILSNPAPLSFSFITQGNPGWALDMNHFRYKMQQGNIADGDCLQREIPALLVCRPCLTSVLASGRRLEQLDLPFIQSPHLNVASRDLEPRRLICGCLRISREFYYLVKWWQTRTPWLAESGLVVALS